MAERTAGWAADASSKPTYAVVFRTHFWDDFAQRQLDRLRHRARAADIYVLIDETRGPIRNIRADRVFSVTDAQILAAGFVDAGEGSIQWYSGDVPLYLFFAEHPNYDFYIQMEYDVAIHLDVDLLVERLLAEKVDVLALTNKDGVREWPWLTTCGEAYALEEVRCQLICLSGFSNAGLSALSEARFAQAQMYKSGELKEWPYCEGYIGTEAARQGLCVAELSRYGDVEAYNWWPPYAEAELPNLKDNAFVHPVLDPSRYVPSLLKKPRGLRWLLLPNSWLHKRLRRLGFFGYLRALCSEPFTMHLRARLAAVAARRNK